MPIIFMGKKITIFVLFFIAIFRIGYVLSLHQDKYIPDYWSRYETLKTMYGQSQYTTKDWKYWLPDETVYAYAGGAYVKGANPILIESTQPPLGKYLIGLSILLFGNENIIIAIFFIFLLAGIFLLIRMMTGNIMIALCGMLIASFERLFVDQLTYTPLLDIFHITFILYGIISASYAIKKSKPCMIFLSFVFLSSAMMTKVWVTGLVFVISISLYIILKKPKYYPYIIGGVVIIILSTLLVYMRMYLDGYTIIEILKVQKWLYWYHNSKINRFFTIWPLIFLNRWYVWWGESPIIKDTNWTISWPIIIGSALISSIFVLRSFVKTNNPALHISVMSILAYALFMSLGQATARYLLPFLPMCYALTVYGIYSIQKSMYPNKRLKKI
jgi:hypothetical protein